MIKAIRAVAFYYSEIFEIKDIFMCVISSKTFYLAMSVWCKSIIRLIICYSTHNKLLHMSNN